MKFLFVGNGSNQNRGCEAIVRGSMEIFNAANRSNEKINVFCGVYGNREDLKLQNRNETDNAISNFRLQPHPPKWSVPWCQEKANRCLGTKFSGKHRTLKPHLSKAALALEVGGDTYTLDYGFPQHLIDMDRWLMSKGIPVVIWGASIGPFRDCQKQEALMISHLRGLKAVFVRESISFNHLTKEHGLGNVKLFADPAFAMEPCAPSAQSVHDLVADGPVCVNISPLLYSFSHSERKMAWEVRAEDLDEWVATSADIVTRIHLKLKHPVLLLPHAGSKLPGIDDFAFLRRVAERCKTIGKHDIRLSPVNLNAAESKWVISRCKLIMAARTHATIAGFSTGVPTISIGYSQKARGINQDIFGSQEFCIPTKEFNAPMVLEKIQNAMNQEDKIRSHLNSESKRLRASAMAAGSHLFEILGQL